LALAQLCVPGEDKVNVTSLVDAYVGPNGDFHGSSMEVGFIFPELNPLAILVLVYIEKASVVQKSFTMTDLLKW
jgi:hypothetical protein